MSDRQTGPVRAVTATEFSAMMAAFGPFEPRPHVAAAVSGGADSLALALLLHRWARARGGTMTALTVDHGLRAEAAAEARRTGRLLKGLGISHRILRWTGAKPTANVQALARRARYALLGAWCARQGVLHLALAHQLEDQAETVLLRLGRGSGLAGLAAMPAVAELADVRLLRPLLGVPRERLRATLHRRRVPWIEDPSNNDPAFARVRIRALMPALAEQGLDARRLAGTAAHVARARAALDRSVAAVLARAASAHPAGHLWLDPAPLIGAAEEVGLRALARIVMTVGGQEYPPRLERLQRLYERLVAGLAGGTTLGGCRFVPLRGNILVVREPAAVETRRVTPGDQLVWDGRFAVALEKGARRRRGGLTIGPLGAAGWAALRAATPALVTAIPPAARPALPVLRDGARVIAVPHLPYQRPGNSRLTMRICGYSPRKSLTAGSFTVA